MRMQRFAWWKSTLAGMSVILLLLAATVGLYGCSPARSSREGEQAPKPNKPPVNPLTGEEVSSWDLLTRRPLAVKVENDPKARPQSGIIDADLVYEELVEGGVTRFICVYLSRDSQVIGPTRSARPSDIDITFYLDPLLICSGGASQVISMVKAAGLRYISEDSVHFWRDRTRKIPHNLYTSTALLRQYLTETGDTYNKLPQSGLVFTSGGGDSGEGEGDEAQSASQSQATSINIPYKATICAASYQYDASTDTYLRSINGVPHTDLTTGKRVAPRNVIVQFITVTGSGIYDVTGAETPNLQVIGSGKCLVFTGGKVYHGTWKKANRNSPTRFLDENGRDIPLHPGQTWIHLVTEDIGAVYK